MRRLLEFLKQSHFVRDFVVYVPSTAIPLVTSLGSLLILVRVMSRVDYGQYVIAMSTINIMGQFFAEWLATSTMRLYGEASSEKEKVEVLAALISCLAVELVFCNIAVTVTLRLYNETQFLYWSCLLASLMIVGRFLTSLLLAAHLRKLFLWASSGSVLVGFLSGIGLLLIYKRPELVLAGTALGSALQLFVFLLPEPRRALAACFKGRISKQRISSILTFGIPVMLSSIGGQLLTFADRLMLAKMSGPAEAGLYASNYSIGEKAIGMAFIPICTASYPLVVRAWAKADRNSAGKVLRQASLFYLLYAIPACIVMTFFSREIATRVLTPEFAPAHFVIPLVGYGLVCWNMGTLFHFGLEMRKQTIFITGMVSVAALINIVLNLIWIPRYGALGAAWATFIAYLAYACMSWSANTFIVRFNWFPFNRVIPVESSAGHEQL